MNKLAAATNFLSTATKKGWRISSIGEECTVVNGGTPKTGVPAYWDGGIRWITPAEMGKRDTPFIAETKRTITQEGVRNSSATLLPCCSVILSSRAPIGYLAINTEVMATNQGCKGLVPNQRLSYKYFFYYLLSIVELLDELGSGTTFKELSRGKLMEVPIPIAPATEQARIVSTLDEAFERIHSAKVNCESSIRNSQALFDSRLSSLFNQEGANWGRASLSTLLERGWISDHMDGNHGGDYPRKEEFISDGVPYISANCLTDNEVDISKAKYLSPSRAAKLRKGFAKDGDVLFAHNATVGPVATLHTDKPSIILGTSLTYYRCNTDFIRPAYLAHYMRSHSFRTQYEAGMRQSTRNQVPITKQREFFHVIPPVYEQETIAAELDQLSTDAGRLERIYGQKLAALDDLKQSLLSEAFSGNL